MPRDMNKVYSDKIFDGVRVANGASLVSASFDVGSLNLGYHTLALEVDADTHNSALLQLSYEVSPDGALWITSSDTTYILYKYPKYSGNDLVTFYPPLCKHIRFTAEATVASSFVFTAWYMRQ